MLRHFDLKVIQVLARCARLNCQPRTVTRGMVTKGTLARCARLNCQPRTVTRGMVTKGILARCARLNCQPRCVGQYRCLDLKFELVPRGDDAAGLRLCDRLKDMKTRR